MLMSARLFSCRLIHLSHQDSCPSAHGSHLTANKVPNSRRRSRFRGIEESDRTTEVRQEDGKKTKQEGKCLSLAAFYCVTRDKHTGPRGQNRPAILKDCQEVESDGSHGRSKRIFKMKEVLVIGQTQTDRKGLGSSSVK
ncbi:hypothetical protein ElyMa_000630000 [Elysia marginata]|uniref:Uncharacterized protein n=1 Tax=Elysia marginata TaxID=1093978 RepID=A0AAV4GB89_9GAST|nr:hypothetical protein ElyMa_000630000 [Elysia marginata]